MLIKFTAWLVSRPAIADWLIRRAKRTPYAHIVNGDGAAYMERYWLFNPYPTTPGVKSWFPISVRLHWIRRADDDRHLHDHPWNARTFILKGGYSERRERVPYGWSWWQGRTLHYYPGDTASLKFGEFHRITEVADGGAWTLFVTGKYRGTWGFRMEDGSKKPWCEYLGWESAK